MPLVRMILTIINCFVMISGVCAILPRVIEQELHKNAAVITKVSETASKEFAIESALDKMQGAWATVKLVIEEYRETGQLVKKKRFSLKRFMAAGRKEGCCGKNRLHICSFSAKDCRAITLVGVARGTVIQEMRRGAVVSKSAISFKNSWGGATVERLFYKHEITTLYIMLAPSLNRNEHLERSRRLHGPP